MRAESRRGRRFFSSNPVLPRRFDSATPTSRGRTSTHTHTHASVPGRRPRGRLRARPERHTPRLVHAGVRPPPTRGRDLPRHRPTSPWKGRLHVGGRCDAGAARPEHRGSCGLRHVGGGHGSASAKPHRRQASHCGEASSASWVGAAVRCSAVAPAAGCVGAHGGARATGTTSVRAGGQATGRFSPASQMAILPRVRCRQKRPRQPAVTDKDVS